jgi:biopolymer transport protein ExbD
MNPDNNKLMWEINITPLTDVFLVLLIIFMAISPMLLTAGIDVNLPKAQISTTSIQKKALVITITKDNKIYLEDKRIINENQLINLLNSELKKSTDKLVIIKGDATVELKNVVDVLDAALRSGAKRLAIATEFEKAKEK